MQWAIRHKPSAWRLCRLKDIADINRAALPETTDPDFSFTYVDIGSVDSDGRVRSGEGTTFGAAPSRARRLVQSGDSIVSTVRTYLKAIAHIDEGSAACVVSTGFATVTPRSGVHPRFLYWWLRGSAFVEEIVARSVGVSYPAVNASDVGDVTILLPPVDEQRRIVEVLDAETARIGELIDEQSRRQRTFQLEWYRSLLVNTMIRRDEPAGWRPTRLKYLFEYERNGIWGDEPQGDENDVVCVRVADFDRVNFVAGAAAQTVRNVPAAQAGPRLLREGDVLLEKSGGTADKPVGCAVSFNGTERAVCSNFVAVLRPRRNVDARYAGLLMAAHYQARLNAPFVKQTTGIQNLDSAEYLGLRVFVPAFDEQVAIVKRLEVARDLLQRRLDEIDRQVLLLREHRQALITAAVTGGLDAVRKVA